MDQPSTHPLTSRKLTMTTKTTHTIEMTQTVETIETMTCTELARVSGGKQSPQAQAVCNRQQFDWMAAHMVPDGSRKPGVQRHVVANDAKMCGFPMPR
jgi:hypothetical protein